MNLRNWSKKHTLGLLLGILTTLVALPLVMFIYSQIYHDAGIWRRFSFMHQEQSRMLSLASIANLIWFHLLIRKENYPMAMGIIMATVVNLTAIICLKYVL